jgi:hypothetical protein
MPTDTRSSSARNPNPRNPNSKNPISSTASAAQNGILKAKGKATTRNPAKDTGRVSYALVQQDKNALSAATRQRQSMITSNRWTDKDEEEYKELKG